MNRRRIVMAGAAAAAGLAGVGAWWTTQPGRGSAAGTESGSVPGAGNGTSTEVDAVTAAFWKASFDTPDGQPLAINGFRGKPLLVNFWATWCPPCVEELPLLNSFFNQNKANGWQLLGLAVDQPSAVRTWLKSKPLDFPVGMAGFGGTELSKSLGNLSGGLPFSVVFGASGQVLHRKTGKVSPEDLVLWAQLK